MLNEITTDDKGDAHRELSTDTMASEYILQACSFFIHKSGNGSALIDKLYSCAMILIFKCSVCVRIYVKVEQDHKGIAVFF